MGWQWHQLYYMQIICTSLQIDSHASTTSLIFLRAGCFSCCPTNSVKALKALQVVLYNRHKMVAVALCNSKCDWLLCKVWVQVPLMIRVLKVDRKPMTWWCCVLWKKRLAICTLLFSVATKLLVHTYYVVSLFGDLLTNKPLERHDETYTGPVWCCRLVNQIEYLGCWGGTDRWTQTPNWCFILTTQWRRALVTRQGGGPL